MHTNLYPIDTAVTSIDSILGPRDSVDLPSSSEGSPIPISPEPVSPEKISPEPVSPEHVTSEPQTSKENDSDVTVVTSISVEVNQHEKGLDQSPNPQETLQVAEDKSPINRDSTVKVTETSEVVIPATGSPKFSLPIIDSGDSSDESSDSESDENMLPGTPPPAKSGDLSPTQSSNSDSSGALPPKSTSPPTPVISIENTETNDRQPNSNGLSNGLSEGNNKINHSPTPDRRRPSGKDHFV